MNPATEIKEEIETIADGLREIYVRLDKSYARLNEIYKTLGYVENIINDGERISRND